MTDYGIENLAGPCQYEIPVMALGHPWWSDHMGEKNWVNRADFDAALVFARRHFKITVIAEEIADDLQTALEQFTKIASRLAKKEGEERVPDARKLRDEQIAEPAKKTQASANLRQQGLRTKGP